MAFPLQRTDAAEYRPPAKHGRIHSDGTETHSPAGYRPNLIHPECRNAGPDLPSGLLGRDGAAVWRPPSLLRPAFVLPAMSGQSPLPDSLPSPQPREWPAV